MCSLVYLVCFLLNMSPVEVVYLCEYVSPCDSVFMYELQVKVYLVTYLWWDVVLPRKEIFLLACYKIKVIYYNFISKVNFQVWNNLLYELRHNGHVINYFFHSTLIQRNFKLQLSFFPVTQKYFNLNLKSPTDLIFFTFNIT